MLMSVKVLIHPGHLELERVWLDWTCSCDIEDISPLTLVKIFFPGIYSNGDSPTVVGSY